MPGGVLGTLPTGTCDCHFHIFDAAQYEYSPQRHYTPPDAKLTDYLAMCARFGIERGVLVHPTVFGADHASFETVLRAQAGRLRGIAVVSPTTAYDDIARWHDLGARGARITTIFGRGEPMLAPVEQVVAKVKPFDWHIQLLVDVLQHPRFVAQVQALGMPVVVDHMGHHAAADLHRSAGFANLCALLREGVAWVKLSAPYRLAPQCDGDADIRRVADSLVQANAERVLWGTDWPHPASPHAVPDDTRIVAQLFDWLPDARLRDEVLVHNPTRLYWNDRTEPRRLA